MLNNPPLTRALFCYIGKNLRYPFVLPLSMVFVTTLRCNSKCKTCFIWRNGRERKAELTVDEYRKIFQSLGRLYWVTLGGGEPFLREDFLQIVLDACRYLKPTIVNIPSNGSRPDDIFYVIDMATRLYPKTKFILNLSLDHIGEKHDSIRGLPGGFNLAYKTIENLKAIKKVNFNLGIHTVISKYNLDDFEYIYRWVNDNLRPDSYIIEDAQQREEFMNQGEKLFSCRRDYVKAIKFYLDNIKKVKTTGINKIRRAFRITYYGSVSKSLLSGGKPFSCYAAYASCQINPDGEVWVCATRGFKLGNLRESKYNFRSLWYSKEAMAMRKRVKNQRCSCNLSNVSYSNILFNPAQLVSTVYNYIRY
ncbi:MAG: radical SAM protein [Candidatus Omnitrophica bacterium]|nr:radical SAM protein [Candidatus Omnitrophota bacterium]MBU1923020.1 radical SAM protein [Candidatus Omnitrophota bacterium]